MRISLRLCLVAVAIIAVNLAALSPVASDLARLVGVMYEVDIQSELVMLMDGTRPSRPPADWSRWYPFLATASATMFASILCGWVLHMRRPRVALEDKELWHWKFLPPNN